MDFKEMFNLLKATWNEWNADRAPRLGAALAYYTVFSLAPLLLIAIAIAGFFFGKEAAQGELVNQISGIVGTQGAEAVQGMIENANKPGSGIVATIISIVTLILGASGLFGELQGSLNAIWGVEPRPDRGIMGILQDRFLSFTFVLGTGFLLLVSLVLTSVLSALNGQLSNALPGADILWQILNFVISFAVTTLLFAAIYKIIPDAEVAWRDVWVGAAFTSLLFSIGRFGLGIYLGNGSTTSVYGAAGSLVVLLLWVYYSAQIMFFGAEFTQVYANSYGSKIAPAKNAVEVGKWSPTAAAQNAVKDASDKKAGVVAEPTNATDSQPASAQPQFAGKARVAGTQPSNATVAQTDEPSVQPSPAMRTLVPFSFVVGLIVGLYKRVRSK